MDDLSLFETAVNDLEARLTEPVENINQAAVLETSLTMQDSLIRFRLLEHVGRVALISFEAAWTGDPTLPIVIGQGDETRAVIRSLAQMINESDNRNVYDRGMAIRSSYLRSISGLNLNDDELRFLNIQLLLCVADPRRRLRGST